MNQIQFLKERQTIESAVEVLENLIGISINWTQNNAHDNGVDGYLILFNQTFPIEEKRAFKLSQLPNILQIKQQYPNLILITDRFSDDVKVKLREYKISYIDTVGNAFIPLKEGIISSDSSKRLAKPELNKDKAFTKKGIAIVFHFLNDETLLNQTYRQISEVSGASLDTITKVIQSLRQQGFIQSIDDKTIRLIDKKRLFEKWADAYENRLKPYLFVGSFRFQNIDVEKNWQNISLNSESAWGGEPAASLLTDGFLRPSIFTLYTTEPKNDLIRNYRFLPDQNGNIKVYLPFMNIQNQKPISLLWTYADLVNSGIARNLEVAEKIYNQYVQNNF